MIYKIYKKGEIALNNINFKLDDKEFVAIMGPSGSGKSTLLNICCGMLRPSVGSVIFNEYEYVTTYNDEQLNIFRRENLGCVFQDFKLIDYLNIEDNIILPLTLKNMKLKDINRRLKTLENTLQIKDILKKEIFEVSGGQKQKTAIARALIIEPKILFADEPTGSLDFKSGKEVMKLFNDINKKNGTTILMVTHDPYIASFADRVLFLSDGSIYNEIYKGNSKEEFYKEILDVLSFLGGRNYEI